MHRALMIMFTYLWCGFIKRCHQQFKLL